MLGLSENAFARLEKISRKRACVCRSVFCPVLCSEGPSMAVTCSAHAMSHVKVHHGPPPGHWNGRRRRGTTLKIWHPAKMIPRGCGLCVAAGWLHGLSIDWWAFHWPQVKIEVCLKAAKSGQIPVFACVGCRKWPFLPETQMDHSARS